MMFSTPFLECQLNTQLGAKVLPILPTHKRCFTGAKTGIAISSHLPRTPALPRSSVTCSASAVETSEGHAVAPAPKKAPLKVVIAGAGIGGLVLAVGLLKQGYEVVILERDLTAIRGEGKYRGPIQIQSNALAALEALDVTIAERVLEAGCITGDRINGLCDGVTGEWYCKFDTFHPAVDKGLPVTRVISRTILQQILADKVVELGGPDIITNGVHIVDYQHTTDPVTGARTATAIAEDGTTYTGDVLVGADGIWSKVRRKMVGHTEPVYSNYTCYTGISDFTPPDIDTVGYRVFLGNGQYFVSSDVGDGKMQWYGFHKEPAGGDDEPGKRKERLMEIFGHWSDMVTDLIQATPEDDVLRRDIYDRPPIFKWAEERVVLLGDSAHAMQPNLGQGGCMAIEDAFQLAGDLTEELDAAAENGREANIESTLQSYFRKRVLRAGAIHGMARMAAFMASTYKAYLGEGLGPLEKMTDLKILHPGRVGGRFVLALTMPAVLDWVLGGYQGALKAAGRLGACRLEDKPQGFTESDFPLFMRDDDALLRAAHADWLLQSVGATTAYEGTLITESGVVIGRGDACSSVVDTPSVSAVHARLERNGTDYFVTDLGSEEGTYLNGRRLDAHSMARLRPSDELRFGGEEEGSDNVFRIKLRHESLAEGGHGQYDRKRSADQLKESLDREAAMAQ